jgi:cytochrome oxidase Cu insertion factor (SCO1/SenC/PrrC family)
MEMMRSTGNDHRVGQIILGTLLACSTAAAAQKLDFQLHDAWGREVRSQDYKGRPLLLEFGACW